MAGSENSDVFIWDIQTKEIVHLLVGHPDVVLGVDSHPTEKIVASCGLDGTVMVWMDSAEGSEE